jgi:putative ABC transport system permease protein
MNRLPQTFAYRIKSGVNIFLFAGLLAMIIVLMTVSYQSVKAAWANPVGSLKYE